MGGSHKAHKADGSGMAEQDAVSQCFVPRGVRVPKAWSQNGIRGSTSIQTLWR